MKIELYKLNRKTRKNYVVKLLGNKCSICESTNQLQITNRKRSMDITFMHLKDIELLELLEQNKLIVLCRNCNILKRKLFDRQVGNYRNESNWELVQDEIKIRHKHSLVKNIQHC